MWEMYLGLLYYATPITSAEGASLCGLSSYGGCLLEYVGEVELHTSLYFNVPQLFPDAYRRSKVKNATFWDRPGRGLLALVLRQVYPLCLQGHLYGTQVIQGAHN
jgi:hypothetical protein